MARTAAGIRSSVDNRFIQRDMGTCLNLNGTTNYIRRSASSVYGTTGYSIELWVIGVTTGNAYLYMEGSSSSNTPFIGINAGTARKGITFFVRNDANATIKNVEGNIKVFDGNWHHVVLTDSNGTVHLYIDAVADSASLSYTPSGTFTLNQTAVGCLWRTGTGSFFTGEVDGVRAWPVALTAQQVTDLYYKNSKPSTPYFEWLLDEGSGSTATDTSGNGRDGSIQGVSAYATDVFMKLRSTT